MTNRAVFQADDTNDFVTPAEQSDIRGLKMPGWRPSMASRIDGRKNPLPMWDRNDVFRNVDFWDARMLKFSKCHYSVPSGIVLPSGAISLETISKDISIRLTEDRLYSSDTQKVFGLFYQFDTMVETQVAALAGISLERAKKSIQTLYLAGILDTYEGVWKPESKLGRLWRLISRTTVEFSSYLAGMSQAARMLLVGGDEPPEDNAPGSGSRTAIKHNLFAVEVLLRLAEGAPNVAGIWGDVFGSEDMFHQTDPNAINRGSWGDGNVVTKNGSIIIFEVVGGIVATRGAARQISEKAASWIGTIANSPLDISVIFIDTTFDNDWRTINSSVMFGIKQLAKKYAPDEYSRQNAEEHIGVIGAGSWFPEPGYMSYSASCLAAYCPSSRSYRRFDVPDDRYSDIKTRREAVMNSATAFHTPPWLYNKILPQYSDDDISQRVIEQYENRLGDDDYVRELRKDSVIEDE